MKTAFLTLYIIAVIIFQIRPQTQNKSKTIPASGIKTVIITSTGDCTLSSISSDFIQLDASFNASGKVYGWSNIKEPKFELFTRQEGSTLFISTSPINDYSVIGISTYKEKLELNVGLPPTINIIKTDCKNKLSAALLKQNISSLTCEGMKELIVNGKEKKAFELSGTGPQTLILSGESINLNLK